jgi:hypothetical protein
MDWMTVKSRNDVTANEPGFISWTTRRFNIIESYATISGFKTTDTKIGPRYGANANGYPCSLKPRGQATGSRSMPAAVSTLPYRRRTVLCCTKSPYIRLPEAGNLASFRRVATGRFVLSLC